MPYWCSEGFLGLVSLHLVKPNTNLQHINMAMACIVISVLDWSIRIIIPLQCSIQQILHIVYMPNYTGIRCPQGYFKFQRGISAEIPLYNLNILEVTPQLIHKTMISVVLIQNSTLNMKILLNLL